MEKVRRTRQEVVITKRGVPVAKLVPFWGCTLRRVTGFPCMGCGLTRAFDRITHLRVAGAFDANPLGALAAILLALLVVYAVARNLVLFPRPEFVLDERQWRGVRWTLLVGILLNWGWVIVRTYTA